MYEHEARPEKTHYCAHRPPPEPAMWPALHGYFRARRLSGELAAENGWYPSRAAGDSAYRVVIPTVASDPRNNFWQARALDEGVTPRYQSPAACRGDAVVVVRPGRAPVSAVVLVEGPFDALAAAGAGAVGIALMGCTPGAAVLAHVKALAGQAQVFLVPDRDALPAWVKIWNTFPSATCLMLDPPYKDLAEVPPDARRALLRK
jgi:hypothetical protein